MKKNEFLDKGNERLREALNLVTNGNERQGLQMIEDFLVEHQSNPAAHRAKAMALAAQGDYARAIESMGVAIDLNTEVAPSHYLELGEYLLETGSFLEAYDALTSAIDLVAESQDAYCLTSAQIARAVASFKVNRPDLVRIDLETLSDDVSTYCAGEVWTKKKLIESLGKLRNV